MADQYNHLVGKKYVHGNPEPCPANSFRDNDLPQKHRVLPPGSMVTMDWVEDRLNVHLDADDVCKSVAFG